MRTFSHWTPRYIKNRLATLYYQKVHPDYPWLTRDANEILASYLTKSDTGLEFGSGRSTIWFANRVGWLTSVEHNDNWVDKVREMLKRGNIDNVEYKHCPKDKQDGDAGDSEYVRVTDSFDADSLDFCLVDGVYREFCALKVIDKIRPGGVLIIEITLIGIFHLSHILQIQEVLRMGQKGLYGVRWPKKSIAGEKSGQPLE